MNLFGPVDWERLLMPGTPLLEIVIRGTVVYLSLFLLLRFVFRRESGTPRISMLLLLVILADAAQNAMADDYTSVTDGLLLVMTLMGWNYALDWLASRIRWLGSLVHPPPLPLVRNGRLLRRNMREEMMSEEELWSQLRLQGIQELGEVRLAQMEGDGKISVVRAKGSRV